MIAVMTFVNICIPKKHERYSEELFAASCSQLNRAKDDPHSGGTTHSFSLADEMLLGEDD